MIDSKNIQAYNKERPIKARKLLCHAPFANLNFEQNGNITACCYNRSYVLGKYPDNTLEEVWFGEKAEQLRQYIRENNLSGGCSACEQLLNSGNYSGTKAVFYDEYADALPWVSAMKNKLLGKRSYPKVLEFEISNICNLECTMCNGYFSSAIRRNREHLPDVVNPFDDEFIRQIKGFIPHLTDAKFLGGEPFMIDLYYKIWDAMIETNPGAKAHITTNGTMLSGKVKDYLEKLNCGIVVSLDAIDKEIYEEIRINANYDRVLSNLHYFIDLAKRKKTYLSIAACPIKKNWSDLPDLVRFCNKHNIYLHFNTVWTPESESLRFLTPSEFMEVISFLEANDTFNAQTAKQVNNVNNYRGVISQIKYWSSLNEQRYVPAEASQNQYDPFLKFSAEELNKLPSTEKNILLAELIYYCRKNNPEDAEEIINRWGGENSSDSPLSLEDKLHKVHAQAGDKEFLDAYCNSLSHFAAKMLPEFECENFTKKTEALRLKFQAINAKPELISELIRTGFFYLFELISTENIESIYAMIDGRFNQA